VRARIVGRQRQCALQQAGGVVVVSARAVAQRDEIECLQVVRVALSYLLEAAFGGAGVA